MSGDGRLHRDGRRLPVTDLTDHDDVRVLTQNGAQRVGEGQVCLRVHLYLIHAVNIRLHRVLHGDDVHHIAVQLAESRIQRGGFTGAGGAGDQHDSVGVAQDLVEFFHLPLRQAQRPLAAAQGLFLGETHDAFLAVDRGQRGNTDIVLPAIHQNGEPAVLGLPLFGDVQIADDLDTGDDGGQQPQVVGGGGVEHAVHPAADTDAVRPGLHMDIGGALAHRLLHQGVHQHDHGGGIDILLQDLLLQGTGLPLAGLGIQLGGLLHFLAAVAAVDGNQNIGGRGQKRLDAALAGDGHHVPALHVHGVVHGDIQRSAVLRVEPEGHHHIGAQDIGPHRLPDIHGNGVFVQPHHRGAGHGGQGLDHLFFGQDGALQKQLPYGLSSL